MIVTAIYWAVAFVVAAYAMRPQNLPDSPPPDSDVKSPISEPGAEIPIVFGERYIKGGNTVWHGNVRTVAIKK